MIMKVARISTLVVGLALLALAEAGAQIRINSPGKVAERQAENRANRKIDQTIDRGFDKVEEGIGNIFKKKDKTAKEEKNDQKGTSAESSEDNTGGGSSEGRASGGTSTGGKAVEPAKPTLKAYSKFDFMPGEKIVAAEDFAQDAVGDFPAKWNTNASAEVVTIDGYDGKWLMIGKTSNASYIPEFINALPENFTLEYDLVYNNWNKEYAYQRRLLTTLHEVQDASQQINRDAAGRGATFAFDGKMGNGSVELVQTNKSGNYTDLRGINDYQPINPDNNGKVFHVALWRQKGRLRVYVDENKVFDFPRAFPTDIQLSAVRFHADISNDEAQVFISNIRLAVGAPDTRSKLITEGKFVTTGITFDVNSATIKPESFAVLKDIAATLTENASVKVKIIGHTDSDGDEASNLALSKKRAEAVKEALNKEFGVGSDRLQTDGKGESEPLTPNTTPEAKANNRRVEFIKL